MLVRDLCHHKLIVSGFDSIVEPPRHSIFIFFNSRNTHFNTYIMYGNFSINLLMALIVLSLYVLYPELQVDKLLWCLDDWETNFTVFPLTRMILLFLA